MEPHNKHNTPYSAADLLRYVNGQMSAEEMHTLEKAALEDPFLSEAIEGYALQAGSVKANAGMNALHARLQARTQRVNKTAAFSRIGRWSIAAVFLLAATGIITYFIMQGNHHDNEASNDKTIAANRNLPPASTDSSTPVASPPVAMNEQLKKRPAAAPVRAMKQHQAYDTAAVTDQAAIASAGQHSVALQDSFPSAAAGMNAITEKPAAKEKTGLPAQLTIGAARNYPVHTFSGTITGNANRPVPEASVLVLNTQLAIEADSNGNFDFTLPDSIATVAFSATGYETFTSKLKAGDAGTHIMLKEAREALTGNTEPGIALRKSRQPADTLTAINAEPETGWPAFKQYIEKNKQLPAGNTLHGTVVLSFTIGPSGKPEHIQVRQSAGKLLDTEATRLLLNGPAWKPGFEKDATQTVTILL